MAVRAILAGERRTGLAPLVRRRRDARGALVPWRDLNRGLCGGGGGGRGERASPCVPQADGCERNASRPNRARIMPPFAGPSNPARRPVASRGEPDWIGAAVTQAFK